MKYLIYCSQKEFEFEVEVPNLGINHVVEEFEDIFNDWFYSELYKEGKIPCGFFPNPNEISSIIYNNIRKRLNHKFDSVVVYAKSITDDGNIISSDVFDIASVIDKLIEAREESEQSFCDTGAVIIRMLEAFLDAGIWQFGLRGKDGNILSDASNWPEPTTDGDSVFWMRSEEELSPIIWFGLEGSNPIECWSITKDARMFELLDYLETPYSIENNFVERWKFFWFCTFWSFDWNALFNNNGDCYITWMFAECDMDEPEDDLDRILKACPIELDSTYTREMLEDKITTFFQRKYNDALSHNWKCS